MDFFIVTPSYNQRQFLRQTIESVLSQQGDFTVTYWVFDGNSNDGSQQLLKSFDKKLQWESKKDKGQANAINKGIKQLKLWLGQNNKNPNEVIFAYINSDDYYLPNVFQFVQKIFQQTDRKWLVGDCRIVDENGKEIQRFVRIYKQLGRFWLSRTILGVVNPIPQPGVFIRASEILKIGFFDQKLRYVMDYDYWFKVFEQSGRPLVISRVLAAFRIHSLSKGSSQFIQQFKEQHTVAQKYIQSSFLLFLQKFHNLMITFIYKVTKKNV